MSVLVFHHGTHLFSLLFVLPLVLLFVVTRSSTRLRRSALARWLSSERSSPRYVAETHLQLPISDTFIQAGLPAGVFNFLTIDRTDAPVLTTEMIAHPLVRKINVSYLFCRSISQEIWYTNFLILSSAEVNVLEKLLLPKPPSGSSLASSNSVVNRPSSYVVIDLCAPDSID